MRIAAASCLFRPRRSIVSLYHDILLSDGMWVLLDQSPHESYMWRHPILCFKREPLEADVTPHTGPRPAVELLPY